MDHLKSNVFYRGKEGHLPLVDYAQSYWLVDSKGKKYLDASGGPVVVNIGYGVEEVITAVTEQMTICYYAHPTMFTNAPVEKLAQKLAEHSPKGINRFYFLTSGSEAVEAAIKMARQVHMACGRPEKFRIISRWKSYHGLSLGALSVTGRTSFRKPYTPMLLDVEHIAPPYCLRCFYGLTFPKCQLQCAKALEETILNLG
ncbi:MAG: aspartate aminotransferase family protein, partial [Deltaproteobacteria bacterium]